MKTQDAIAALKHMNGRLPVVINTKAVTRVAVEHGRIRRDLMSTTFREMPDKPRDAAVVLHAGPGDAMSVKDIVASLGACEDLELFVNGEQVSGFEVAHRRMDGTRTLYLRSASPNVDVVTPTQWSEGSDGERRQSDVWVVDEDRG